MTLVYRSPKQQAIKPIHELGPGSYDLSEKKITNNRNNCKSSVFVSSSTRDPFDVLKQQKEREQTLKLKAKQKQSQQIEPPIYVQQNGSYLLKQKKSIDCTHVFTSKVQRFSEHKSNTHEQMKQFFLAEQFKKLLMKDISAHAKGKLLKAKDKLQKQKQLDDNHQAFPSIPNCNTSFGYRFDSESNKWVCNQNPNIMEMMLEKHKNHQKVNQTLGPGCYVYNPNKSNSKNKINQPKQSNIKSDSMGSFTCPNLKPQTPIHNSIEEIQHKKKLRIRLIGQSQINKAQQLISQDQNPLLSQSLNLEGKNTKQVLLLNQMYKNFKNYIPRNDRKQPSKFFQKIKQKKQCQLTKTKQKLKFNDISNTHQHFLARSQRFDFQKKQRDSQKADIQGNQQTVDQTINNSVLENSTLIHKTYNCKEPYSLGEDRFKENKKKQNIGPGTYKFDNMQSRKLPPCLNLKEERFHHKEKKSNIPGPGEYNVSQEMLKKPNNLSNAFSYYKNINNEEIRKHFKRQDSMEALYQTWGRQMNYIVKMEHQSRPQNHQEIQIKQKENTNNEKSLTKTKKQLETELKRFNMTLNNSKPNDENTFTTNFDARSVSLKSQSKCPAKIYPKITQHLYEYGQKPHNDQAQNIGPGKYQTRKDMVKKTFNVTYT